LATFSRAVRRIGQADRGLRDEDLDDWIRVVAAARLGEGFGGADAAWLLGVADGSTPLFR